MLRGISMTRSPFFAAFDAKMSPKLGAMTTLMPASTSA